MKEFHFGKHVRLRRCCLLINLLLLPLVVSSVFAGSPSEGEVAIIIVAGQSNVLNWHASAAELPAASADSQVDFYYHTGAPPQRDYLVPFNATSHGNWTALGIQRQDPYVKGERDFFGPEITLARALLRSGRGSVAVIKIGYFGTNLAEDWAPDAVAGARLYVLLRTQIRQALAMWPHHERTYRLAGFFWMQGETDGVNESHARQYADNLAAFVARLRRDLGVPELPFVFGRVGPTPAGDKYRYQELVRAAQVRAQDHIPKSAWVDTDDLPRDNDGIHLLAPGVMTLGERWAAAWLSLTASPTR